MTIQTSIRTSGPFVGTGTTTVFAFAFKVFEQADLLVVEVDTAGLQTELVLDVDYTVSLNSDQETAPGGFVTLTAALATDHRLTITSDLSVTQPASVRNAGRFYPGVIEDALDRIVMLLQQQQYSSITQTLRVPEVEGTDVLPAVALRADKLLSWNSAGKPVAVAPSAGSATALALALASATGDTLIGMQADVAGSVPTTFAIWSNGRTLDARVNFSADDTGASNTTAQLLAFFNACITNGRRGFIPHGSYLATAGQFVFSTPFADAVWPQIFTDGASAVVFKRADATNAPMFQWNNGTATSGVGRYWRHGCMGGFTVDQNGKAAAAGQHGVAMRGVWKMHMGQIIVNDGGGSALYFLPALYGGSNPDPYAVTACDFEGVEANRCDGWGVQNDNYVGLNGCTFRLLRVIECKTGGFFGFGAANEVRMASMGTVKGWAFDDGCRLANTGGSPSRFTLHEAELDDVQNGFRLNKASGVLVRQTRLVHRHNFSVLNPGEGYWPRKAVEVSGGTLPAVSRVDMDLIHRVETGGLKAAMGAFVDCSSNGNVTDVKVNQSVVDNAGFGFSDTDLFTGLNSLATVDLRRDGYRIADQTKKQYVRAEATVATTIANTGFTSTKIQFPTEVADGLNRWNGADTFTASFAGSYRVKARIALALSAAGKQVRLAWMVNGSAASHVIDYSRGTGVQYYELDDIVTLAAGDTLWLSADQNDVASKTLSAPINIGIDNHVLIEAL